MANEFVLKDYSGGAVATTLSGGIAGGATSLTVVSGSGLPDGSAGPFVLSIDRTTLPASEEKVLCTARVGNVLTVQRGYDGTAAVSHLNNASVEHVLDAFTLKQANALANMLTAKGDIFVMTAAGVVRLAVGSNGQLLVADSTLAGGVGWSSRVDVQVFAVAGTGTWTKPAGTNANSSTTVVAVGSGGGGGGGRRGAAGSQRTGGGGGGGGERVVETMATSVLGATETTTVGAVGTGGAQAGGDNLDGGAGGNGGDTSLGTKVVARGGKGGVAGGAASSAGGLSGVGSGMFMGAAGAATGLNAGDPGGGGAPFVAGGGGGGGSVDSGNISYNGGAGGANAGLLQGNGAVVGVSAAQNGVGATTSSGVAGTGGGGGAGGAGGNAQRNGGSGGAYGGGGGGGGGVLNGGSSGIGGAGQLGILIVITHI